MPEQFKNMNELIDYLSEKEIEIQELKKHIISLQEGQKLLQQQISSQKKINTNLVNPNFFKRAFTVWGHFIVANLIISIPWVIYTIFMMLLALSQLQPVIQK